MSAPAVVTETTDLCALPLVRRLAAMLDRDPGELRDGDPLPRGWHVALFSVDTPQSLLREDGMAGTGVPLPDVGMPRVVMGGRRLAFDGDVPIGAPVRRRSTVESITPKAGRSGPLTIVTMRNAIHVADDPSPAIVEVQDYVFRGADATAPDRADGTRPAAERPAPDVTRELVPDETLLFRYCAITSNPHRIHFDLRYTQEREGFRALVVNGGLTSLLATELFRAEAAREPTRIETRNVAPLFCGETLRLHAARGEPAWRVWAEDGAGRLALEGTIA